MLRSELYSGINDVVLKGNTKANQVGKRSILPSSHTGSPRFRVQNYQDTMAICKQVRYLDIFVNITCNLKWDELVKRKEN